MAVPKDRRVVLGTVAVLSVAGLLLTGCTGSPGGSRGEGSTPATSSASVSPSGSGGSEDGGSASPSASVSASPTGEYEPATAEGPAKNVPVPEMPDAVKEPTEEGLEAAVEYWWEAANYLRQTGDESPLQSISTEECELCQSLAARWVEIYELEGWGVSEAADVEVQFIKMDSDRLGATGSIAVSEKQSQVYQPNGEPGGSGDGSEKRPWVFAADFHDDDGQWRITEFEAQG